MLVLVALAGLAGAWFYYANFTPDRVTYPVRGIDVSHHQGDIDWPAVARSDVAFAVIKATEGGDYVDESFARNFAEARAAGLAVGAYHFFTFCRPGAEQARNFLRAVPLDQPMLPPVVDIEFSGNCATRPSVAVMRSELADFLGPVEAAFGREAIVYVLGDAELQYLSAIPERPRWVRSLALPPGPGSWVLWQYHNAGRVAGIEGDVDLNVLKGGHADLDRLVASAPPCGRAGTCGGAGVALSAFAQRSP